MVDARLVGLDLDVEPAAWAAIGVHFVDDVAVVGGLSLHRVSTVRTGLSGWAFADDRTGRVAEGIEMADIDGIPTRWMASPAVGRDDAPSLGVVATDHLVVMTSSLERTCTAISAATGAPLRRVREVGGDDHVRQGFHRSGGVVLEVVESRRVTAPTASLWGLVWTVGDLDAVCRRLGSDLVGAPREAVQRGRRIAAVRAAAGLGMALALMSPDSRTRAVGTVDGPS